MANNLIVSEDTYTDEKIISGVVSQVQSLDGDELQYDTLNATLDLSATVPTLFVPSDADAMLTSDNQTVYVRPLIKILVTDPTLYSYGTEVLYKHNGVLVGKYYMTKMTRVGKTQYQITCVSPVGLLANSQHYGGIYSGTLFLALLEEIIGGVVPFTMAPELANQPVYGWLPVATRRDNLHQALFAMGASALKDSGGDLYIAPLSADTHGEIADGRMYLGGSVKYPDAVTGVSVSEHTYVSSEVDETVTLFEGLVASEQITTPNGTVTNGTVVLFSDPMHDLVIADGEILESGVNYAVLAPSAACKLTGQKYTHTVRQVTRPETVARLVSAKENKITVTDATLVSIANSENVADRLMSYYSSAKTITTDIVVDEERAGTAVQFTDPFGDITNGIIKSLDINMSNTLKGRAEIVADYTPGGAGNYYQNVEVISADGEWTVPSGVEKIRIVLIGGGDGGSSGANGTDGTEGELVIGNGYVAKGTDGDGGEGGQAGSGGLGGRIFVKSISVVEGDVFTVTVGEGGSGGICEGTESVPGGEGTDTTFGEYTSADGTRSATGYAELFGGVNYAVPGVDGIAGLDGLGNNNETGDTIIIDGVTYVCGTVGEDSLATWTNSSGYTGGTATPRGGHGGGAAAGANGGDGEDAYGETYGQEAIGFGGAGGAGATAAFAGADGEQYGSGGSGGHGGGGGGGGGSGDTVVSSVAVIGGKGGAGGLGSNGGQGAQGCVLVYY